MKAIRMHSFGPPEVMKIEDVHEFQAEAESAHHAVLESSTLGKILLLT